MYYLDTTRVLYQTSRYAPVRVLQLDIRIPEVFGSWEQISTSLDRIGAGNIASMLPSWGKVSEAQIYSDLVLGLQQSVGHPVQYCRIQGREATLEFRVFVEYEEEAVALFASYVAIELLNSILQQQHDSQLRELLNEFEEYSRPRTLDSNTRLLINAARRQDIPVIQPLLSKSLYATAAEVQNSEFQLGWGIYLHRCNGVISEKFYSPSTLEQVLDRAKLYPRLINSSIPLPDQDLEFLNRNQVRRAQRSAQRIGFPVILRPRAIRLFQYCFQDDYVFGPLENDDQVALVSKYLRETLGLDVWVESYIRGDNYRFLVINGEVLSVVRCKPPVITGDGIQTIAELTKLLGDADVTFRLRLNGLTMNSVLKSGIQLVLRGSGSPVNGGSCENVTSIIPGHFMELAFSVAEQSGLTAHAGIDLIIDDLNGRSAAPNCIVNNVVPDPDLHMFEQLSEKPNRIGDAYLATLFPEGTASRIPIVSVTGTNGKTTSCRMVTQILRTAGLKTGLACTDGVYLDNKLLRVGDSSGVSGAIDLLVDSEMEAAVLETARGGLANTGIAYDHCNVGACLNIAEDHLGEEGIETLDDMAIHKRQVIERTTDTAVLNAEDPRCLAMCKHAVARQVMLVAYSTDHPAIKKHCTAGGKAIAVDARDGAMIVLIESGDKTTPIVPVIDIPATFGGAARHNLLNTMFAIAMGLGLGIEQRIIVSALTTLRMDVDSIPGRLNEITGLPYRVFADVVHNAHGMRALVEFVDRLPVKGKKIINMAAWPQRPDEGIRELAKEAAGGFDLFIVTNCYIDNQLNLKNRTYEEVPEILKNELLRQGVREENIIVELDVMDALDETLKNAQEGDLLMVNVRVLENDKFEVINKLEAAAKLHR